MNRKKCICIFSVIFILAIIFYFESRCYFCKSETQSMESIIPKIANLPIPLITPETPQEVKDLIAIIYALEKYKIDNSSYPLSSENGTAWDGFISSYGASGVDWIHGLVPTYIDSLPRDPRNLEDGTRQYLYFSNGANYKLIVHKPDNCENIEKKFPSMVDPIRECYSYGFWSAGGGGW